VYLCFAVPYRCLSRISSARSTMGRPGCSPKPPVVRQPQLEAVEAVAKVIAMSLESSGFPMRTKALGRPMMIAAFRRRAFPNRDSWVTVDCLTIVI
jgi:hypothetical protein